jgi:virulence-associated protein E/bifunctional DNA primase/polymerase-like protein/primase-like protein
MTEDSHVSVQSRIEDSPAMTPISPEQKIAALLWYARQGMPIFPCGADKQPIIKDGNGLHDATTNETVITRWHENYPRALWGVKLGAKKDGGAGIVVIDIDVNHENGKNGFATWDALRDAHSEPIETVTQRTKRGGLHYFFKYPDEHIVPSKQDALGEGIDIKSTGGYVIVPPSDGWNYELSPRDVPLAEMPEWILSRANGRMETAKKAPPAKKTESQADHLIKATAALKRLKPSRADEYDDWLHVGMALYELGADGLALWDEWSQESGKYVMGECAKKWKSFEATREDKYTLASLFYWAKEDSPDAPITVTAKQHTPAEYAAALESFGHTFSLNDMNDHIYYNGVRLNGVNAQDGVKMNDILTAVIEYQMRNHGYKSEKDTQVAIYTMAYEHKFHPIRDYLEGLILEARYDGEKFVPVDHIQRLRSFFEDKDGTFELLLRKWLVGAVGRILGDHPGQQHPMLVIDGPQGIGKSRFVWWLGSPLPSFYIQSNINPNDKDFLVQLCSKFVWEVDELGATFKRSDIESLKSFLSKETVSVRKAYGKDEITKPATASFIGTINNSGGFLGDPTGNRRFRVCTVTRIDWAYEAAIDINQLWAQAMQLYRDGERWELTAAENERMKEINERYEVEDSIAYILFNNFNLDPTETERVTATAQIIEKLRLAGVQGNDNSLTQRIATILTKAGCERKRDHVNGQRVRVWGGVWERDPLPHLGGG